MGYILLVQHAVGRFLIERDFLELTQEGNILEFHLQTLYVP